MNKKIILCLLALIFVAQSIKLKEFQDEEVPSITHNNQQKFRYPRADQSCSNPVDNIDLSIILVSEVFGWYWDGQVCQPCAHPYCVCSQYRQCDKCVNGYARITNSVTRDFGAGQTDSCQRCQDLHSDNYSYLNGFPWFKKKEGFFDGLAKYQVDDCKVFLNNSMNGEWQKKRGDNWTEYNFQVWRRGFRALHCGVDRPADGIIFRHYGSVCWYILGCQKYTKWGKCDTCMDGYYRDNDQICQPCRATCVDTYDDDYKYPCALTDNDASEGCMKCAEKNHCSVCKPGYWLASEAHYTRMHDQNVIRRNTAQDNTLLDDPSWCVPCPAGCRCQVVDNNQLTNDPINFFDLLALPGHYKDLKAKFCPACDDGAKKIEGCKSCTLLFEQEDVLKCTRCMDKVKDPDTTQDIFYYPTPIANQCLKCPNFCTACEIIDNTPSCLVRHCMNGSRFVIKETTDNKMRYRECVECKKDNAIRCETDDNDTEIITQCITGATSNNKNYDDEILLYREQPQPRMNFYPPQSEDYHLVMNAADKTYECRKNDNLCMFMKFDGTCTACYEDQGYYLDSSNKCTRCNVSGCLKCDQTNGKCATCKEGFFLLKNGNNNECRSCNFMGCSKCAENAAKDDLKCIECRAGYKIMNENSDTPSCEKCNVQNCSDCAAGIDTCTKCLDRFLLWDEAIKDESSGKESVERKNLVCETCDYGCIDCVVQGNRKFCNKCQDNMFLHSGACQEMQDNCVFWETNEAGSHKCNWCKHGYRLDDGRCMKCMSPDVGVIHCHTKCEGGDCWYSTINDFNLYPEEGNDDEVVV